MEWISVKDDLPAEGIRVLNINTYGEYTIDYLIDLDWKENIWLWACQMEDEHIKVTHWMPLPQPPKE